MFRSCFHWIRCQCHIINIAFQNIKSIKIELLDTLDSEIAPFRKNIISIRRSYKLLSKLNELHRQDNKDIKMKMSTADTPIRWGSTYVMFCRAFDRRRRKLIEAELDGGINEH